MKKADLNISSSLILTGTAVPGIKTQMRMPLLSPFPFSLTCGVTSPSHFNTCRSKARGPLLCPTLIPQHTPNSKIPLLYPINQILISFNSVNILVSKFSKAMCLRLLSLLNSYFEKKCSKFIFIYFLINQYHE